MAPDAALKGRSSTAHRTRILEPIATRNSRAYEIPEATRSGRAYEIPEVDNASQSLLVRRRRGIFDYTITKFLNSPIPTILRLFGACGFFVSSSRASGHLCG